MVDALVQTPIKRPGRIKTLISLASVMTIIGLGPIIASFASSFAGKLLGCGISEAGATPCLFLGRDIAELLYTGLMMGWLALLVFPVALIAVALWVAVFAIWIRARSANARGGDDATGS